MAIWSPSNDDPVTATRAEAAPRSGAAELTSASATSTK
jgi:hypothetical protein